MRQRWIGEDKTVMIEQSAAGTCLPVLSIVIVSWNTSALLVRCLQSLAEGVAAGNPAPGEPATEILVVDNASKDDTVEIVRSRFPDVQLIANRTNVGFAAANNQALARARGEYVLLLNPDTEVSPGALRTLTRVLDARPAAGAAGPQLVNPDGSPQVSTFQFPTLRRELLRMFHLDAIRPRAATDSPYWATTDGAVCALPVDGIQGACLLLRRSALDQVGLLDEDYFIYSEEVDLCYRLAQAGWGICWAPQAKVMHYGGQSTRQASAAMFLRLYEAKILYFRKHHGRVASWAYKLILASAALTRLLLAPLAGFGPERRKTGALAHHYGQLLVRLPEL